MEDAQKIIDQIREYQNRKDIIIDHRTEIKNPKHYPITDEVIDPDKCIIKQVTLTKQKVIKYEIYE